MQFSKSSIKTVANSEKRPNFLGDLESMTNNLSFETNLTVLAQFDEKWHTIKDSYFKVQYNKESKIEIDEVRNHLCCSKICGI